jgi:hypothetical protein
MVGNSGDAGANLGGFRGSLSGDAEATVAPVLEGVSDAELDAIVSKLRTDKNRIVPVAAEPRAREDMLAERLHRSRPRVSAVAGEAVCQAWYVELGAKASGPYDVEALRGRWERGELGPDSLCWREGFSAWVPLCQVPELAGALSPLPQERLPEPGAMPAGTSGTFELKGAEALRILTDEEPFPELDFEAARVELSAPVSTREPVLGFTGGEGGAVADARGMPAPVSGFAHGPGIVEVGSSSASVEAYARGSGFAEAGSTSVDPVGTHAVLVTPPGAGRSEVRWRGALWLAILGGVSGGVAVAVVLALLGSGDGRALLARMTSRDAAGAPTALQAGAATPAAGHPGAMAPGAMGTGPGSMSGASGPGVVPGLVNGASGPGAGAQSSPGVAVAGAAPGVVAAATGPGADSPRAPLAPLAGAAGGIDRGGAVPVLSGAGSSVASSASGAASAPKTELSTVSPPPRARVARPSVSDAALALEKRPSAPPPVAETSFESEEDDLGLEDEAPTTEEKTAAPLGPDEAFDRELSRPPPGAASARKERTVYVPPDPSKPPATLAQSDVFEVVLANKGDITACAREQQAPPREGGRVVVRWSILPTGKVDEVVTETASLQGTPLARCIEAKVRAWSFPRHQEQGAPVRFPFVF